METTRSETLKVCIAFTFLIAVLLLYFGIWSLHTGIRANELLISDMPLSLWAACGLFMLGSTASLRVNVSSTPLASWLFCILVGTGIFFAAQSFVNPYRVLAFLLPILYAVYLFEWGRVVIFLALALSAAIYLNFTSPLPGSFQTNVILPCALLLAISIFLAYTIHVLFSDLQWYETNYVSAQQKERIIRENEGKLERLVKDLKDYQNFLNITNDLLARARDEAEKAKNAKQVFVQNVSHELRTPLNLIIGFSETMYNTPEAYAAVNWTPELKTDVECVYRNSQHLKSLIDDVLDMASLENRSYEINSEEVDINSILLAVVLITRDRYAARGLMLTTDLEDRPLVVRADPVRIRQVLLNLLSNALKYTRWGGVIMRTRALDGRAVVEVEDTGKGIPADALDKVFEAFYQVDKSRNRDDSGTGLGLTISKQLIELQGGEIHISSDLGKGTLVSFSLSLVD